jgi:hypothetical protein
MRCHSLAYRAHLFGEPVPTVRSMGHEKLIGRDLLVAIVAAHGEGSRNVYLPSGRWYDYHSNEVFDGERWIGERNVWPDRFDRLNVLPIRLPALRERREDIPLLAAHFLEKSCALAGSEPRRGEPPPKRMLADFGSTTTPSTFS